jgi:hypothetical protein
LKAQITGRKITFSGPTGRAAGDGEEILLSLVKKKMAIHLMHRMLQRRG